MDYRISYGKEMPGEVALRLPASKSISNRLLMIDALSGGGSVLYNLAECDDTVAMRDALRRYRNSDKRWTIDVDTGAAGTATRFLTAFFASQNGSDVMLDGSQRMRQRPIVELTGVLFRLGATITHVIPPGGDGSGCLPLHILGKKLSSQGREIQIRGDISSQYISALMMIGPYVTGGLSLVSPNGFISRPYIEMTASIMRQFGAEVETGDDFVKVVEGGYRKAEMTVESDWSAASYWYEIKALVPELEVRLKGLCKDSLQGDSRVAEYFRNFGVTTRFDDGGVVLGYDKSLLSDDFQLDLSDCPDLAQTVVVTACLLGIMFRISGLRTLRIKETDRFAALQTELGKLGYRLHAASGDRDALQWDGAKGDYVACPQIATYKDHRMAMAFAPAAVQRPGLIIEDAGVVSKSYPGFWDDLRKAGFSLEEKQ